MTNYAMIRFTKFKAETAKAYLVSLNNTEFWLPKKLCRKMTINKKLGGNVQIPEWLYIEKLGHEPPEKDYTFKVEKHIPERIEPISNNTINELKR